jgi:hypothetical protein
MARTVQPTKTLPRCGARLGLGATDPKTERRTWSSCGAGAGIDSADLAIAAGAQISGLPFVTMNVGHFPMFPGLQPPY